jgi:hypothetical protein
MTHNGAADEWNEAAASFRWLVEGLGLRAGNGSVIDGPWAEVRDAMRRPRDQVVASMVDWISDPWLARGVQETVIFTAAPAWDPPDDIDAWPTFDVGAALSAVGMPVRRTRDDVLRARLATAVGTPQADPGSAVAEFYESEARIAQHGDTWMVLGEQVRGWLLASCGSLLRGVLLSPSHDADLIVQATTQRLAMPGRIPLPTTWVAGDEFGERRLELLLNLGMQADGNPTPIDPADVRVGQGTSWRETWAWLSQEITAEVARHGVRLAARLLRNEAVREGVMRALLSDDPELRTIAVAVVRRWALTLKAMSWVEDALAAQWVDVRPTDVVCFGFNALKPDWPRRLMAVSHRSAEVKPTLRQMPVWGSSRWAIDATYVPAWETNTGMIWGLFGPTPAIARVQTPTYGESQWCRREAEMIEYLAEGSDFLSDRHVMDVDIDSVEVLAALDDHWSTASSDTVSLLPDFPPIIQVWTPPPLADLDLAVLRAAGALRAMSAFLRDPALVNSLVTQVLPTVDDLPGPAPTNHPDGWRSYARIFSELRQLVPDGDELPILLPAGYSPDEIASDDELLMRVPDLASGSPALDDVLVAIEFLRTRWPIMVDEGYGRFLALNLRGLSYPTWTDHPQLSLQRGLVAIRTPVPLWLIQVADQDVSSWELPGDPPILTEHMEAQFGWLTEMYSEPDDERARYPDDSGLQVSAALRRLLATPA